MEKRFGFWLAFINLLGGLLNFGLVIVAARVDGLPPVEPYQTLISVWLVFHYGGFGSAGLGILFLSGLPVVWRPFFSVTSWRSPFSGYCSCAVC